MEKQVLARKVRIRRTDLGLNQGVLAEAVDKTHTAAHLWEKGKTRIPHEFFPIFAKVLKVNLRFFYEEDYWPPADGDDEEQKEPLVFDRDDVATLTEADIQWFRRMGKTLRSLSPEAREAFRTHLEQDAVSIQKIMSKSD